MIALILSVALIGPTSSVTVEPTPAPAPATVSVEHVESRDGVLVTAALVLVFAATALVVVKS